MSKNSGDTENRKVGRPSAYKEEYAEQAFKYCLLGATDAKLANFFDVCEDTINNWKMEHPEFLVSIRKGKEDADSEIANALYHRAKGYSHPEDKIFNNGKDVDPTIVKTIKHYPPDTAAAFIWLKNRSGWRDKQEHEHSSDGISFNMNFGPKGE